MKTGTHTQVPVPMTSFPERPGIGYRGRYVAPERPGGGQKGFYPPPDAPAKPPCGGREPL